MTQVFPQTSPSMSFLEDNTEDIAANIKNQSIPWEVHFFHFLKKLLQNEVALLICSRIK